jgi:hypothetical protein
VFVREPFTTAIRMYGHAAREELATPIAPTFASLVVHTSQIAQVDIAPFERDDLPEPQPRIHPPHCRVFGS